MSGTYQPPKEQVEAYDVTSMGEGLKRTSSSQIELDHDQAAKVLEIVEFTDADRRLRPNHVKHLHQTMIRGTFVPSWVTIIVCRCNEAYKDNKAGTVYRMNGQHTSWARLEMPKNYRCPVNFEKWTAKTVADMRQLYASIDRGAKRTKANVLQSYLGGSDQYGEFASDAVRVVAAGLETLLFDERARRRECDGDSLAYLMLTDHYDTCQKACEFYESHKKTQQHVHLWRAPVSAVMIESLSKAPVIAKRDFWEYVATGVGFDEKYDARLTYRNALMNCTINTGNRLVHTKRIVSGEQMFRWGQTAWNAFREGRELRVMRAQSSRAKLR